MKTLKKAILPISKVFPAGHKRAGDPTDFEAKIASGEKIHTIRHDSKGVWVKRFAKIQAGLMYLAMKQWTGRPYNSEMRDLFQKYKEDGIGLQDIEMVYGSDDAYPRVWVNGIRVEIQELAKNDGLSVDDFVDWFFGNGKENTFTGVIINFTDYRY